MIYHVHGFGISKWKWRLDDTGDTHDFLAAYLLILLFQGDPGIFDPEFSGFEEDIE